MGRKLAILILIACLLFISNSFVFAGYNDISLTVTNGGFEEPVDGGVIPGWTVSHSGGTATVVSSSYYNGGYSLQMVDNSSSVALGMRSGFIAANAGIAYEAEAHIYLSSGAAQLYLQFYDTNQALLGSSYAGCPTYNSWQTISVPATSPAGTKYVKVLLYSPAASTGTAYYDDVSLFEKRDLLISNYSFESYSGTDPTSWTLAYTGGTATVSTDQKYSGDYSLKMYKTGTTTALGMQSSKVYAVPSTVYVAQAKFYLSSGPAQLYMRFYDSSQALISSVYTNCSGTGLWKTVSVTGTAPANTAYVAVMAYIPTAYTGTSYFDDVVVSTQMTNLGPQITSAVAHGAAFGQDENGNNVIYAVLDGSGQTAAKLIVIDYNTNRIIKSMDVDVASGATSPAWAVTYSSDGKVYMGIMNMGTNKSLYRYTPGASTVESLGIPASDSNIIWDVKSKSNGDIYLGTYSAGKLYKYVSGSGFSVVGTSPLESGESYVRSVAVDNIYNAVFAGLGSVSAHLKRIDLDNNQIDDILPSAYHSQAFVYDLHQTGGKLIAKLSPSSIALVLDVDEDGNGDPVTTLDCEIPLAVSLGVTSSYNNNIYFADLGDNYTLYGYNTSSKSYLSLGVQAPVPPIEMETVSLTDQTNFPGYTVVGLGSKNGEVKLFKYNLQNDTITSASLPVPSANTQINYITGGPGNRIYSGGFLNGGMGEYTTFRSELTKEYKGVGQSECLYSYNDKLYMGIYPMARIYEYDPAQAWTLNSGGSNPELIMDLHNSTNNQDRPYAITGGGDNLFVGTMPGYGKLGGALSVFDLVSGGNPTIIENIVQDQSIVSLAYKNGKVYGGSSIWGGLGSIPTATDAKFFVYDVATGQKTSEITPVVGEKAITAVIEGPDGNIWGMDEGYLFIYNVTMQQITYCENKFPFVDYTTATMQDAKMLVGKDGNVYLHIYNGIYQINASTKVVTNISVGTNTRGLAQDNYGNLYFFWRDNLYRYAF